VAIEDLRREYFPDLSGEAQETSPKDDCYNCIAWAAGDTERYWWPIDFPTNGVYWPIPPEDTVQGFIGAFVTLRYEVCDNGDAEAGFEKVVLYVDATGAPSHMARQLPSGKWTSKIGKLLEDIEHPTPEDLCGFDKAYGRIDTFMKRPIDSVTEA
jgi:hypothetical protein